MGKKKRRDYTKGASHEEWYVYDDDTKDKAESEKNVAELRKKLKKKKGKMVESEVEDMLKPMSKGRR